MKKPWVLDSFKKHDGICFYGKHLLTGAQRASPNLKRLHSCISLYVYVYLNINIYLQPQWRQPPQNKAFSNQNKGPHLGSRYM